MDSPGLEPLRTQPSAAGPGGGGGGGGAVPTPPALAARLAGGLPGAGAGQDPPPVLDPACGDGELLLAALRAAGGDPRYALQGLHGIDLDGELVGRARERLGRATGLDPGAFEPHLVAADALDPATPWPAATWILANPPWVSFSGRQARVDRSRRGRGSDGGPRDHHRGPGGWPCLQSAFLERIARHVGDQGTGALVLLPGALTELEGYGPLREAVTRAARLAAPPLDLGEDAFPGVTLPAALVSLAPRGPDDRPSPRPWVRRHPADEALLAALEVPPRLPPGTFADPGVHTGNRAADLVRPLGEERWPGLRQGRDLAPFALGPPTARLRTDLVPGAGGDGGGGGRFRIPPLERLAEFPLLLRQTASRPLAALHREPTYFRNSLLAGRRVPGLEPAFVVAVLNASPAAAWHRLAFRDARQRSFPQVKVRHLASQPFPIAVRAEDPRLHDALVAAGGDLERIDRLLFDAFGLDEGQRARVRAVAARSPSPDDS